jgi:sugar phosphate permease
LTQSGKESVSYAACIISVQKKMMKNIYKSKHYPWFMIAMLFLMYTASTVSTNSLPIFYPEIRQAFGWTHAQVSEPASYYFIFIACIVPIVGFLLVRFKPTHLMFIGFSVALISTLALTKMSSFMEYFGIYFLLSVAISLSGLMPCMVLITNWFSEKRGLAVGIFLLGSSIGGIVFPEFTKYLMKTSNDWRYALTGVGILAALLSFLPLIFIKNKPDFTEQTIANTPSVPQSTMVRNASIKSPQDAAFSLKQAALTPVFWLILLITAAFWFCGFAVLTHLQLYLKDLNFDFTKAIWIRDLFFIFSIIGKISFGYFSDRFDKRNILIFGTVCLIIGIALLKMVPQNPDFAYAYAVIYGFGYSGAFTMIQLTVADYYKGATFSKVLGFVSSFDAIGGFLGVRLLGIYRTADGNYDFGFVLLFIVCIMALLMSLALRFGRIGVGGAPSV